MNAIRTALLIGMAMTAVCSPKSLIERHPSICAGTVPVHTVKD